MPNKHELSLSYLTAVSNSEHGDREEDSTHSPTITSLFFALSIIADPRKGRKGGWRGGGEGAGEGRG